MQYLESVFATVDWNDGPVSNLIAVSFVENLLSSEERVALFRPLLGPSLARQVRNSARQSRTLFLILLFGPVAQI